MTASSTLMITFFGAISVSGQLFGAITGCDSGQCNYNTECATYYTDYLDHCFMSTIDAWDGNTEGFCLGGSGTCNGVCQAKKSLGDECPNAAGNYDNNNCVTGLCSSSTGKCELRTQGCQSLVACVDMGAAVALALAEYTAEATVGAVVDILEQVGCAAGETLCYGNMALTVGDGTARFSVVFDDDDIADGIFTATGEIYLEVATDLNLLADIAAPKFKLSVPDVVLGIQLTIAMELTADGNKEKTWDFVVSDELRVCTDPFNKKRKCNPYIFFERVIKMGYVTVDIEIGFQVVGALTGAIETSAAFTVALTVDESITAPEVGVEVTSDGFRILGLEEAWNQIAAINWIDNVDVTIAGGATVSAEFELSFGPQLFVIVNGVQFQGGLDFVFKAGLEFTAEADTESGGCVSGGAAMSFGLLLDFYSPPFDLAAGAEAACTATVGAAQEVIDIAQDIQYDKYGTACAVQHLDYCDERFDLCSEAAEFVADVMGPLGDFATSPIFLCKELVDITIDLSSAFSVNGGTCGDHGFGVTAVTCFDEARPFSGKACSCGNGEGACGVDSTISSARPQHSAIFAILLIVVSVMLFCV